MKQKAPSLHSPFCSNRRRRGEAEEEEVREEGRRREEGRGREEGEREEERGGEGGEIDLPDGRQTAGKLRATALPTMQCHYREMTIRRASGVGVEGRVS